MTAYSLAQLRSSHAAQVEDFESLGAAAERIGCRLVRVGSVTVLARHPDAPAPQDLGVKPPGLSKSALLALGLCVGLAWADRDRHPYPGRPIKVTDLMAAAREIGVEVGAARHFVGAVRHVLSQASLLELDGDQIRLGPAIAGWSEGALESLRRNIDVLPNPVVHAR